MRLLFFQGFDASGAYLDLSAFDSFRLKIDMLALNGFYVRVRAGSVLLRSPAAQFTDFRHKLVFYPVENKN